MLSNWRLYKDCHTPNEPASSNVSEPAAPTLAPHCEVPCGIYADQMRFEQMLEDTKTIAKAIDSINEFAAGLEDTNGFLVFNQLTDSVFTKTR